MLKSLRSWRGSRAGPPESPDALLAEIVELGALLREQPSLELGRELLSLRHRAGAAMIALAGAHSPDQLREFGPLAEDGLAAASIEDLDGALVRGGILGHGYVLVRGLIDRADATRVAERIDAAFAARESEGGSQGLYEPFVPAPRLRGGSVGALTRTWVEAGGGLLAADSPLLMQEIFDLFERVGLRRVISEFLGEPAAASAEKCTLRKAMPGPPGGWHQDGSFIQTTRALNVWVSLSDCGVDAPGLDFVPRRLEHLVETGGEGSGAEHLERPEDDEVSAKTVLIGSPAVELAAGEAGVARPRFAPGDVMLFDDRFLHRTGSEAEMANPRFAIESWFFGASAFPADYVPLAF